MGSLRSKHPQTAQRRGAALTAALVASLVAAAPAPAGPRMTTSASRTAITVGDTLTYRVQVVAAEGSTVLMPQRSRLGDFEVLGLRRRPARSLGDGRVWTGEYLLATYATGERAVAPPPVLVVGSAGDTLALASDTTRVTVESVLAAGDQGLRDIKGPATIARRGLAPALVGVAAAAVAAFCIVLILRRRRALEAIPPGPLSADVAAIERLDGLLAAGLLERGRLKEYYMGLSEALRRYLEDRYLVPAPEMTTAELAGRLEYLGLPQDIAGEACEILLESDMVKFAKYRPELETAFGAAERTRELILRSARGRGAAGSGVS
jgi:hypothetical protein